MSYDDDAYLYSCHNVGINGGCGYECPVFLRGDCDIEDEMIENALADGMKEELIDWGLIEEDPIDPFDDAMEILK